MKEKINRRLTRELIPIFDFTLTLLKIFKQWQQIFGFTESSSQEENCILYFQIIVLYGIVFSNYSQMKVAFPLLFRFRKPVVSLYLDYYLRPLQRIVYLYFCYHTYTCKEHRYIGAFLPCDPIVIRVFTAKPGLDFFPPQGKLFITEAHMQWKGEERVRTLLSFHSLCG